MGQIKYNVLWIEDEASKMSEFVGLCADEGIKLEIMDVRQDAILELERNLKSWDAVIMDVKMPNENKGDIASNEGFMRLVKDIMQMSIRKILPCFVFTGQPDRLESEDFNNNMRELDLPVYNKNIVGDHEHLINDIKRKCAATPRNQVKAIYKEVFSSSMSLGIDSKAEAMLLDILYAMHRPELNLDFDHKVYYNQVRQILEHVFLALNRKGIIPKECLHDNVGSANLNQCFHYIVGNDAYQAGVRYGASGERVVSEHIESVISSILYLGNKGSHAEIDSVKLSEEDMSGIQDIFTPINSKYILFYLALQLCETICWFAQYVPEHKDNDCNKVKHIEKPPYSEGQIVVPKYDDDGVWYYEKCQIATITNWDGREIKLVKIRKNKDSNSRFEWYANWRKCE